MVIDAGCTEKSSPTFVIGSDLIRLKPKTYYKWQARLITNFLTLYTNNNTYACRDTGVIFPGYWNIVGFPNGSYFSFKTP